MMGIQILGIGLWKDWCSEKGRQRMKWGPEAEGMANGLRGKAKDQSVVLLSVRQGIIVGFGGSAAVEGRWPPLDSMVVPVTTIIECMTNRLLKGWDHSLSNVGH